MSGKHVDVDLKDLKRLERDLTNFKRKALPYASRAYTNNQAFAAQTLWRQSLPEKMKLRTSYTVSSVQVRKTSTLDIARQEARVGSTADYMETQELGATQGKAGKHGVAIPAAAPGKRKLRGRTSKAKQLKAIKLLPRIRGHRSRQVAASLALARKRGGPQYAFLQLRKGRKGIYLLDPGKKRSAIRKVWDLSKGSVSIPRNPTMGPSVEAMARTRDGMWKDALTFQLKRHKILGYR